MTSILYNALMAALDGIVAWVLLKQRRPRWVTIACASLAGLAAVAWAVMLGEDSFGVFRLLAYGVFAHAAVLLAIAAAVLAAIPPLVAVDAFLIEPTWLEVSHVRLSSPKLRRSLRIAVVADLQTDVIGDYERRVLRRVMEERPDLIVMPGDYVQAWGAERRAALRSQLREALREAGFRAPLGVYAVEGNVDNEGWPSAFEGLNVACFVTTAAIDVDGLRITGLTLADSFNPGLRVRPVDAFHIVVGHAPDFALGDVRADLLIAGHTHGGQVQLPFIGPLITFSTVPRTWGAGGVVDLGGRTLVVSRGIGMERGYAPRLRFLCRPEIVVIDVSPGGP